MRRAANVLRYACALVLLALASGCLTGSVRNQRVTRYRPNVRPFSPPAARVLAPPVASPKRPAMPVPAVPVRGERPTAKPGPAEPPPMAVHENDNANLLKMGDQVTISILGVESINVKDVIDDRGNVNLPLIGQMKILGLTTIQAEELIEKTYIDGEYYTRLTVTVVAQKEDYFIHGQVMKVGRFPWTSDLTLLKAIGAAGGFSPFAKESRIELQRGMQRLEYDGLRIKEGKERDPPIKPGDVIVVPRRVLFK
jgi:polysaccharide biosynthesis/export protein VpsN